MMALADDPLGGAAAQRALLAAAMRADHDQLGRAGHRGAQDLGRGAAGDHVDRDRPGLPAGQLLHPPADQALGTGPLRRRQVARQGVVDDVDDAQLGTVLLRQPERPGERMIGTRGQIRRHQQPLHGQPPSLWSCPSPTRRPAGAHGAGSCHAPSVRSSIAVRL